MEFSDVVKIGLVLYFLIMLAVTFFNKKILKSYKDNNVRERLYIHMN